MTRPVNVRPAVHLITDRKGRAACGARIYTGMPGTVTAIPGRVTCGRCERIIEARRRRHLDQPPVAQR